MHIIFWNSSVEFNMRKKDVGPYNRYIGPYKIAHWMKKHNYECQVIDFINLFTEEQLYNATKKFITKDTLILALSTTFISHYNVYEHSNGKKSRVPEHIENVIFKIRTEFPNIKFVVGGHNSEKISIENYIDATIQSYYDFSEDVFLEYANHLRFNSEMPYYQLLLNFLEDKKQKKRIWFNKPRQKKYNIEDDDFYWRKEDIILEGEPLPLDISKGCIFKCKFCNYTHIGKKKFNYIRNPKFIEDELIYNYENFKTTNYTILCDTFNDTEYKVKEFYNTVSNLKFKINYSSFLRADLICRNPDTAYYLKESGLWGPHFGIETLHPDASLSIGKGWSGKEARDYIPKLFHEIWKGEVPITMSFMFGLPNEPLEHMYDTARWFVKNNLHHAIFFALNISKPNSLTSVYTNLSEFEKNSEKYGYKFLDNPKVKEHDYWENGHWNSINVKQYSQQVIEKLRPYNKVSIWSLHQYLWSGFTKEELLKIPRPNLDKNFDKVKNFYLDQINIYYDKLMSL